MSLFCRLLAASVLISGSVYSQDFNSLEPHNAHATSGHHAVLAEGEPERDCANGIDDNNNGLIDLDDFHCYFDVADFQNYGCQQTRILWASGPGGLYRINVETGEQSFVRLPIGTYDDVTWAADGKIYVYQRYGGLLRVDPNTFETVSLGNVEGYNHVNGMTGDASGNLYLCASATTGSYIVCFNIATQEATIVLSLSEHGLSSAGDLCFMNGYMYVSCNQNILAEVNLHTKSVRKIAMTNPPTLSGSFGLTTLGDGHLYISGLGGKIYRVDPGSGEVSFYGEFPNNPVIASGYASYADICNAPCRSKTEINIRTPAPFCSTTGVALEAIGSGISNDERYTWTVPGGRRLSGPSLTVFTKGEYKVLYHTSPDTCSANAKIFLDIIPFPSISLGIDTAICQGSSYQLQAVLNEATDAIVWHDGATTRDYTVAAPGTYYATASNVCGAAADTLYVSEKTAPSALLSADTVICNYDLIELRNLLPKDPSIRYTWSDDTDGDSLIITKPGIYWLEADNYCSAEIVRDSIVVDQKIDGCECFLYVPNAFTPNNDGINEVFASRSNCDVSGSMQIYNRWGELIFTTTDLQQGWNGSRNLRSQPAGEYVFVITYRYERRPGNFVRKGVFHLLR